MEPQDLGDKRRGGYSGLPGSNWNERAIAA